MKLKLNQIHAAFAAIFGRKTKAGKFVGRVRTRDVAFKYRMGAGYPGDINRTHPASIEPCLISSVAPPTKYGQPVIVDTSLNAVRPMVAGDVALTRIYGITVRPYPEQQTSGGMTATLGDATPPVTGVIDVARAAYIMTRLGGTAAATKDGLVYVWTAVSSGSHVQGSFEAEATGGSTAAIANARFNGPADSGGVCEVIVWNA